VAADLLAKEISGDTTIAVFRIFQELLTNVLRHARASRVDVRLTCASPHLRLEVRDNGCGFQVNGVGGNQRFGLLGMRERAQALGGDVVIMSEIGKGTEITVLLPLDFKIP
jgi:signal transduction histidine kinase